MFKKLFTGEKLVELDNVVKNINVLSKCFIVNETLKPSDITLTRYKRLGQPLSLHVNELTLIEDAVKQTGVIVDKENREIASMELEFENGRIKRYDFRLKGILKGKKLNIHKFTTGHPDRKGCTMVDISNTLDRAIKEIS